MTDAERTARKYKKALNELTLAVSHYLALLDAEMKTRSSYERGSRIAMMATQLDIANDRVLRFTFGQSFESISKRKKKIDRLVEGRTNERESNL